MEKGELGGLEKINSTLESAWKEREILKSDVRQVRFMKSVVDVLSYLLRYAPIYYADWLTRNGGLFFMSINS